MNPLSGEEHLLANFDHAGAGLSLTDLRLTVTRSLMVLHGGYATVNSVLGKGSTFSITPPAVPHATLA